jgi:CBS domain-containing protein
VPVVQEERLIGEVSTDDIKDWPAQQWGQITVGEAMGGWKGLKTVRPEDDVSDAMQVLEDDGLSQLLVVEEGRLVGMLTRTNLLGYLQLREELGQRA